MNSLFFDFLNLRNLLHQTIDLFLDSLNLLNKNPLFLIDDLDLILLLLFLRIHVLISLVQFLLQALNMQLHLLFTLDMRPALRFELSKDLLILPMSHRNGCPTDVRRRILPRLVEAILFLLLVVFIFLIRLRGGRGNNLLQFVLHLEHAGGLRMSGHALLIQFFEQLSSLLFI